MYRKAVSALLFILLVSAAAGTAQVPEIAPEIVLPEGRTGLMAGDTFYVRVNVGGNVPVTNLYGVSFILGYDTLLVKALKARKGDFLDSGLFLPMYDPAEVAIGMTATSGPGSSGSGTVAEVEFQALEGVSSEVQPEFFIFDIKANDPENDNIELYSDTGIEPGDVTGDGVINIFDLLGLLKELTGASEKSPGSDCNGDGVVNIFDLLCLLRILAG
ncbi:MAG: dockerin type I domain-containing protein [Gemmatimonadota bacterium]|nr:dockerin type I domain-containing protein [Gemmatimonadota bacterium]